MQVRRSISCEGSAFWVWRERKKKLETRRPQRREKGCAVWGTFAAGRRDGLTQSGSILTCVPSLHSASASVVLPNVHQPSTLPPISNPPQPPEQSQSLPKTHPQKTHPPTNRQTDKTQIKPLPSPYHPNPQTRSDSQQYVSSSLLPQTNHSKARGAHRRCSDPQLGCHAIDEQPRRRYRCKSRCRHPGCRRRQQWGETRGGCGAARYIAVLGNGGGVVLVGRGIVGREGGVGRFEVIGMAGGGGGGL